MKLSFNKKPVHKNYNQLEMFYTELKIGDAVKFIFQDMSEYSYGVVAGEHPTQKNLLNIVYFSEYFKRSNVYLY